MDNYIVSARKYRPMTFDSVVGQSSLTTTLKNAVKGGKLAHAYLFCGPRGVGKTTCARIFAKAINCMSPTEDGEACNHCESCISFNEQRSYNIFELDAASNNSVENIKTLMEQTRIPQQVGKYKVFFIDEVHMLSTQAFNAFLKTLEEPPAHVIFILATTEKHKILPTIISRCQIYDFERMTVQNIINHLKMVADQENVTYEEEALAVIAEKADGGMRDALSIFDQAVSFCQGNITYEKVIEDLNVLDSNYYFTIIDLALENKVTELMVLLNSIISKGFDGGNLILGLASHVRNVLMARDEQTVSLLEVSQQQRQRYQEQAKKCPIPFLYKALKIMNQCDINYRQSNNKRLLVELTLIQVAQITQPDDDAGAGHSPNRLKSLFKKLISNTLSKPAVQVAGTESIPVSRNRAKQDKEEVATRKEIKIQVQETPKPNNAPKLKLGSLMNTFGSLKGKESSPVEQELQEPTSVSQEQQNKFTQEDLQMQWMMMCNRMPEKMVGLASRMKNLIPNITEYPNVEVVVDNQILLNQLQDIKSRIKATLARDLNNGNLQVEFRLAEGNEFKKPLTKREVFDEIRKQNPAIEKLRILMELELI